MPLEPLMDVALDPVVDVPLEPITGALGATDALLGAVLPVEVLGGFPVAENLVPRREALDVRRREQPLPNRSR